VLRDCDGVSFRIQGCVIANLKYLHMLPTVLTRSRFIFLCLFNIRGRVSGYYDNMLMYGFSKSFAELSVRSGDDIIGIVTTVQTRWDHSDRSHRLSRVLYMHDM
jgi:hypothetical protein